MPMAIDLSRYQHIVVLTGAGVSAASGLPTYRGPGGLWEKDEIASLATHDAWLERPDDVWALFAGLRAQIGKAEPNAAHLALAKMEALAPSEFTLITQNVDGLHQRAGSQSVVELHGSLHRSRCSNPQCTLEPFEDKDESEKAPLCALCASRLRPDIVLFGEELPVHAEHVATRSLRDCDLFIAVGTSGTVSPASRFVRSAEYAGAHTVLVNLEAMEGGSGAFREQFIGKADQLLAEVFLAD
jgi:NAD-dependent deacetylase